MIHETLGLVKREFRPHAAFDNVAKVSSHHRIQCSPGIGDAVEYINSYLGKEGLMVETFRYPAKKGVNWWAQDSFPQWEAKSAELLLLEDGKSERLCSFAEVKCSLIQRSAATPPGGISTTMVLVEKGDDPQAYDGLDVKGKFVFSRGSVADIAKVAVDRFGAAGIVVDTMMEQPLIRDRFSIPDARQYLSFWPSDFEKHNARGFVLSTRQGAALRAKFAHKKELRIFASIDSRHFDGTLEVMSAVIPGETDEEVVGMAHVCHPEPSANDNASGCGALMEAAATLRRLIDADKLPKPKRTIRFLWLPEMTGSYAYLANNQESLGKIIAGINLDMVGENQALCGSTFNVEKPIKALPGFGGDLAEAIMYLLSKEVKNLGGTGAYPMFRWAVSPYSGGSDHNIWGDPTVGVTCPMLIQWPDKFYHTSQDTLDKVDPHMLGVAGILTASYLYVAASKDSEDATFLAREMALRFPGEADASLSMIIQDVLDKLDNPGENGVEPILAKARRTIEKRLEFLVDRKHLDVDSLLGLAQDSASFQKARLAAHDCISGTGKFLTEKALGDLAFVAGLSGVEKLPQAWQPERTESDLEAKSYVPKRVFRGPFRTSAKESSPEYEQKLKVLMKKAGGMNAPVGHLEYWADGKRTLAEIADIIEGQTGFHDTSLLVEYFRLMLERGVFTV